jgi:uncharacterized membrane protein YoaK (UPF0700 family)
LPPLARVSGNEPGLGSPARDEALRENKLEQAAAHGQRAGGSRHTAIQVRDGLVVVLALTSGAIDAVTFVRLGNVFSSVITGNLALLGLALGERHGALATSSGLALAAYAVGVLAGGALAGPIEGAQRVWPRRTTLAMAAELIVLAGFSAGWLAAGGHPSGGVRMTLLALTAAAMGVQSAAVRLLGQMSTTYLTSTLIGIFQSLAVRRVPQDWHRSTGVMLAFVAGAALGVAGATVSPVLVVVVVMLPLAVVVLCAARSASLRQPRAAARHNPETSGLRMRQRVACSTSSSRWW